MLVPEPQRHWDRICIPAIDRIQQVIAVGDLLLLGLVSVGLGKPLVVVYPPLD